MMSAMQKLKDSDMVKVLFEIANNPAMASVQRLVKNGALANMLKISEVLKKA